MASDKPWQSYHTVFTNAKAGMDGVDKEKVQKVVYEMSKGSKYFENEQRKEAMVMQRVQHMQVQAALLTDADLACHEKAADAKISSLEAERDISRLWMHVDLDAFYAAVETLEDPLLVGKPMAVGGMSMICTANYEARKFGVRAAMPGFIACKLCPELVFVRPNFEKYTHYSEKVREVFRDYDPLFLARSLDEAYLDITELCRMRNMASEEIAEELRKRVFDTTGLTCSAGVGPNRMIAKVCSDINKPNGQYVVPNNRAAVMAFVSTLPIRKVSGIGKVTEQLLKEVAGISVCEDLIKKRGLITALFSTISTDFFLSVGLGIGGSDTPFEEARKSLSCERTFSAISSEESHFAKLEELADNLASDMDTEALQGRTLTLKLKTVKFEVRTRSLTLPFFIFKKEDLLLHASKLLKAELPVSLRLMGLRISHFQHESSDTNQRTLADYFHKGGNKQPCSPPSKRGQECLERAERSCSPMACECVKSPGPPQSSPSIERDDVAREHAQLGSSADDRDLLFQEDDYDALPECGLVHKEMRWFNDDRCSLCRLEIPSCLAYERQEHVDFHYAQMLQQKYSNMEEPYGSFQPGSKRHQSTPPREPHPKRGRVAKAEASKEKTRYLPIEAFFSKV